MSISYLSDISIIKDVKSEDENFIYTSNIINIIQEEGDNISIPYIVDIQKKNIEKESVTMSNYDKERLLEMFEVISSAADFCRYLLDSEEDPLISPEINVDKLLDVIYPRLERIMTVTEEINEFVENFANC